jgi:exonuclease III
MNILRIATCNANGLLNHKQNVITYLHLKKIGVLLISESHFTDLTTFNIPQYITYSTPPPGCTTHGGSLIIICKSIPHNELPKYQTDKIQATTVEIKTTTWQFTVTAIYSPPRHNISTEDYKDFFQSLGSRLMVGGDWNAKHTRWGSRVTTTKGRNLLRKMTNNTYNFSPTENLPNGQATPKKLLIY